MEIITLTKENWGTGTLCNSKGGRCAVGHIGSRRGLTDEELQKGFCGRVLELLPEFHDKYCIGEYSPLMDNFVDINDVEFGAILTPEKVASLNDLCEESNLPYRFKLGS